MGLTQTAIGLARVAIGELSNHGNGHNSLPSTKYLLFLDIISNKMTISAFLFFFFLSVWVGGAGRGGHVNKFVVLWYTFKLYL